MVYRITVVFLFISLFGFAQQTSRTAYIEKYNKLAKKQMEQHGIPASITLAQALLESQNGNSELASKSNNHFGIKCHSSWTGDKVYHDDDKKQECFRKYDRVEESYYDHSIFLKGNRYQFLYDIPIDNYKGWAKGLKKAGYATNPKYASLLIKIIEDNNLTFYDRQIIENKDSTYFVNGFAYGWPYLFTQQFLYVNHKKEYYINGLIAGSLRNISAQVGGGKLLTKNFGLGLNAGVALSERESNFNLEPTFGLNSKFVFETKNKKIVIDLMLQTNTQFELTPAISIGLLN
jgi:hypothetical protein